MDSKNLEFFIFLWDSSVNLIGLLRKIGRHGPQIHFPRYASLEKQNGDSFSQNMAFLSLFCGLQYLSSKCPEEIVGKHCLERLHFQFISEVYGEVFDKLGKNPRGCKKCIQSGERKVSRNFFWIRHSTSILDVGGKFSGPTTRKIFQPQLSDLHVRVQKIFMQESSKKVQFTLSSPFDLGMC